MKREHEALLVLLLVLLFGLAAIAAVGARLYPALHGLGALFQ